MALSYERYCAEIVLQTDLLRTSIDGSDLTLRVPTCPQWNLGQLLRHLGGGHRWVETIARTRATQPPSDEQLRDLSGFTDDDPALLSAWLAAGAEQLAETLRAAGPDAQMWTPVPGETPMFWARRFAHETVIHRADATLAVGGEFKLEEQIALDAIDEWMELGSRPQLFEVHPEQHELLGPGRTVHLHATDTAPEAAAEWLIDFTGDTIIWRRSHEKAAVAVRGPLTDLLLVIYRRQPPHSEVHLLDFWLERVGFG